MLKLFDTAAIDKYYMMPYPDYANGFSSGGKMENVEIHCKCGKIFFVPVKFAGRKIRCNSCNELLEVPIPETQAQNFTLVDDVADEVAPRYPSRPVYQEQPPKRTSGLAIASLILGVCGFITIGLTGIVGLILGIVALSGMSRDRELGGKGLAIAGVITSSLSFFIIIAAIAIPSLVASLADVDEGSAVGSLSAIRSAEGMYKARYKTYGTLSQLGAAGFLLDRGLVSGYKNGYSYNIVAATSTYTATATPDDSEKKSEFRMTESGVLESKSPGDYDFSTYDNR